MRGGCERAGYEDGVYEVKRQILWIGDGWAVRTIVEDMNPPHSVWVAYRRRHGRTHRYRTLYGARMSVRDSGWPVCGVSVSGAHIMLAS